ncbi:MULTISPECIES: pyridoxamine 5'-phosphate oxidase family protein [unclassified Microbacterium]|uniref:pyridoxamine 5'-phosphate oxidase family protein n=1 Tax=unclassified Microbacterium TaxID=2609290 RepID=UPI00214BB4A1|nr:MULTISPECIES: pyridoxamine 5'-phosphate oxidase family protein [unclassified Microbacterium]MCR2809565.1 pyridoxamine 5'-phosphate oxidase family protein [Microbacterium sp. zg.B185]WIM18108.1 pyridoxamine 5'-phosphate oxidase family protein [Microbacterium sp. zg-B185]
MGTSIFNDTDETHVKALRMLERDLIAWIVTLAADGSPRAVPVWFFWHDGVLTILSEPDSHKVENIRRGSPVLVHLDAGGQFGDDVVVLRGDAHLAPGTGVEWLGRFREPYLGKYAEAIADYGMPADAIAERFSTRIDFTPTHLLAW